MRSSSTERCAGGRTTASDFSRAREPRDLEAAILRQDSRLRGAGRGRVYGGGGSEPPEPDGPGTPPRALRRKRGLLLGAATLATLAIGGAFAATRLRTIRHSSWHASTCWWPSIRPRTVSWRGSVGVRPGPVARGRGSDLGRKPRRLVVEPHRPRNANARQEHPASRNAGRGHGRGGCGLGRTDASAPSTGSIRPGTT